MRKYIRNRTVHIYGSPMELIHKVIFVPLPYSKLTDMSMDLEQKKNKATGKISNQSYSRFKYNLQVKHENEKNYGSQVNDLPDPVELLAVRKFVVENKVIFGKSTTSSPMSSC